MSAAPLPRGDQRPRLLLEPPRVSSAGSEAVELAASAGLILDEWQQYVLEVALGEAADGRWAAFEVALVVARQNGKGSVLEALELAALFLLDLPLTLHSAHEFKTAKDAYRRVANLIQGTPALADRVAGYPRNATEMGIDLKSGHRLRFIARSSGSGRGYTADLVVLDEAFKLDGAAMAALLPTLSAVDNPQIWYASSAPMATSEQLQSIRQRAVEGIASGAPGRLAFLEWSAPPDAAADDPAAIAMANPAVGGRIDWEFIDAERAAMPLPEYRRERMGIPDDVEGATVFPGEVWAACEEWPLTQQPGRLVFAVEVTPDRDAATIMAAGVRPDGRVHVEVIEAKPDTAWLMPRLLALTKKWRPGQLVIDPGGPAGSLLRDLDDHRIKPRLMGSREVAQACGAFYDAVLDRKIVHLGQPELDSAVVNARQRRLGNAWAWDRYNAGDAGPLMAASIAAWAVSTRKARTRAVNLADALAAVDQEQ
jgi:phage terminase large subunit-like protein